MLKSYQRLNLAYTILKILDTFTLMDERNDQKKERENGPPVYVKYIGLSFQLFGIIGAGTYFGWWLQQRSDMKFPLWILVFCFFSVFVAFYQLWISMKRDR